jgi:hypothetical protein
MSRKHYRMIAEAFRKAVLQSETEREVIRLRMVADEMATMFAVDNDCFNRGKFMEACGL